MYGDDYSVIALLDNGQYHWYISELATLYSYVYVYAFRAVTILSMGPKIWAIGAMSTGTFMHMYEWLGIMPDNSQLIALVLSLLVSSYMLDVIL